jgi:hypothetical protein
MYNWEECPVCHKSFTEYKAPKVHCRKHLSRSNDPAHKNFCNDIKETYAESHEERKKHLNKMRQQRRRRKAAEKAKSNNEVYIQGLRARYRR